MHPYLFPWEISSEWLGILAQVAAVLAAAVLARGFAGGKGTSFRWGVFLPLFGVLAAMGVLVARRYAPFDAQPLPIHTYGLMIAVAFLSAIHLSAREAERIAGVNPEAFFVPGGARRGRAGESTPAQQARQHVFDIAMWIFLGGMGGAWLLYVIINGGGWGFVFYGGFIGAALAAWVYANRNGINMRALSDLAIPGVALGHFFGRMGCMSAGCCWGKVAENPDFLLGAKFPPASVAFKSMINDPEFAGYLMEHGHTPALHPTQMYDGGGELILFVLLLAIRPHKRFHGQLLALWLMGYAILRLSIETFRGDFGRGMLFRWPESNPVLLSTSQIVGIVLLTLGVTLYLRWKPKAQAPAPVEEARAAG